MWLCCVAYGACGSFDPGTFSKSKVPLNTSHIAFLLVLAGLIDKIKINQGKSPHKKPQFLWENTILASQFPWIGISSTEIFRKLNRTCQLQSVWCSSLIWHWLRRQAAGLYTGRVPCWHREGWKWPVDIYLREEVSACGSWLLNFQDLYNPAIKNYIKKSIYININLKERLMSQEGGSGRKGLSV